MMSRISISLRREAAKKRIGLITADDSAFNLDTWEVNNSQGLELQHSYAQGSSMVCQHVSIVPANVCTTGSALSINHDYLDNSKHNSLRGSAGSSLRCSGMNEPGINSTGTQSISPELTPETAIEGEPIATLERVVVIAEPTLWNEPRSYELRTMRPVHL